MNTKFGKVASFHPRFYQIWSFYLVVKWERYVYIFTFSHIVRPADHLTSGPYD